MSNTNPSISVIVPAYNVERYLGECLDSILAQSFGDLEVVVVNDCSPDGSGALAEGYAAGDSRVRVINKPVNEGTMMARGSGIQAARGKYMAFCDGDDFLPAGALEILYNVIEEGGDGAAPDIVYGGFTVKYEEGGEKYVPRMRMAFGGKEQFYEAFLRNRVHPSLSAAIFRRGLFDNNEIEVLPGQNINEDYMLQIQLLRFTDRIKIIGDPVYYYRLQSASATQSRPTMAKLEQELRANNWCYAYLTRNSVMSAVAKKQYIRRIVKALEAGFTRGQVLGTGLVDRKLFNLRNIFSACGLRYTLKYLSLAAMRAMKPKGGRFS